jgi:hypothetical protein
MKYQYKHRTVQGGLSELVMKVVWFFRIVNVSQQDVTRVTYYSTSKSHVNAVIFMGYGYLLKHMKVMPIV